MAPTPSDISALSRVLTAVDSKTGPKDAAVQVISSIVRAKSDIGLETHEIYGAIADGHEVLSPAGITARYQCYLHRYLTDIGALVFNVFGAYLVIQYVKEQGLAFLKSIGNMVLSVLPPPVALAVRTAYAGVKALFKDEEGNAQICRDEAGLANLPPAAAGAVFETMLSAALPLGMFGLLQSAVGSRPASSASGTSVPSLLTPSNVLNALPSPITPAMQTQAGAYGPVSSAQPSAPSTRQVLTNIGTSALNRLAGTVIDKIGGLFGDEARDMDIDRVIYEEAIANGVAPEVLKAAVNDYLSGRSASDDVGYGFSLPDIDQDTR